MSQNTFVYGAVALLLGAMLVPMTMGGTPLVNTSLGLAYSEDFEAGDGGWTAREAPAPVRPGPVASTWAWGAPTSGPAKAASGANAWATNLAGNYNNNECDAIMSPPIDLTGATTASVSFANWRHFELSSSTGTAWDAGLLFVSPDGGETLTVVTPAGGYATNTLSSAARTCFNGVTTAQKGFAGPAGTTLPAATYTTVTTDLSAFAGQTVQFILAFGSDGTGQRTGWYVDDFAVTIDGVTTVQDFETSDGGFTVIGTKIPPPGPNGWEYGTPTNGPGPVSAMWATNIDGNYGPNECHWVESPAFTVGDLPGEAALVGRATLTWTQWFKASSGAGVVQVGVDGNYTNVVPDGGYKGSPSSTLDACLGHVTSESGAFQGTLNPTPEMTEFQADLTPWLGETVTIRFLFASTTSTSTSEGWYVDDVNVETVLYAEAPDAEDLVPSLFGTNAPLWTSGGVSSTWAYGVATSGPANETVYGTNLAGNYNSGECSWIESPEIPVALLAGNASLTFDQWYHIESTSSTATSTFDGGVVLASTDGGATWSVVDTNTARSPGFTSLRNCLTSLGVPSTTKVTHGISGGWVPGVGDLTSLVEGKENVRLRFAFGSDGSVQYPGWYLKNVKLGALQLLQ